MRAATGMACVAFGSAVLLRHFQLCIHKHSQTDLLETPQQRNTSKLQTSLRQRMAFLFTLCAAMCRNSRGCTFLLGMSSSSAAAMCHAEADAHTRIVASARRSKGTQGHRRPHRGSTKRSERDHRNARAPALKFTASGRSEAFNRRSMKEECR